MSEMQLILAAARGLERKKPPDSLWPAIMDSLDAEPITMSQLTALKIRRFMRLLGNKAFIQWPLPKWSGALALLVLGIFLGRYILPFGQTGEMRRQGGM